MTRDHNLLFGVFAVQLGKVTPVQLMDAAAAWAADQSRDLPSRLVALNVLSEPDCQMLQRLVEEAVASHDGNAAQTLASFGGENVVRRTYRGAIVLTADGQVSIPAIHDTIAGSVPVRSTEDASNVRGVFESPGRYTELREHARGGMGRVLLVHDDFLGREIALKELLPHLGEADNQTTQDADTDTGHMRPSPIRFSAHILSRFLQEARITGQLEHPSIVPVYELGHRRDGSLYYTMKLVRGRSLSKALKECKNLEDRLRYLPHFVDLCQAIAYAHSRKIIHRDIKPANVMVGEFGETVVLDWGLAKKRDREDVHRETMVETLHDMNLGDVRGAAKTAYGDIMGTPVYMAPEQARGDLDAVDQRSDLYSLGVVLYEILTGKVPFDGESTREVLLKVLHSEPARVDAIEKDAPPELVAIAAKAMTKVKEGRYENVRALSEEVARFQSGALVRAYRYSIADYTRLVWRRHKPIIATACGALLLLVAVTAIYLNQLAQTNRELVRARDDAVSATESALLARDAETAERRRAEHASYVANVRLAEGQVERGEATLAYARLMEAPETYRDWEWGHLYIAMDRSRFTLHGQRARIAQNSFSPDGGRIVAVSDLGQVQVLDARTGVPLMPLRGEQRQPVYAIFNGDGTRIATITYTGTVSVWDAGSGEELHFLTGHEAPLVHADFSGDGTRLVTASQDGIAKVWSVESGQELFTLTEPGGVWQPTFDPGGARIVSISNELTGTVWDAASGQKRSALAGHRGRLIDARFDPSGARVVTASRDRTARIWNADTGELFAELRGHTWEVNCATFSPDGSRVATVAGDDTLIEWDGQSGQALRTLTGHSKTPRTVQYSPDGSQILTAGDDGTAKLWSVATGIEIFSVGGRVGPIRQAVFSPDGSSILTLSAGGILKMWDAHPRRETMILSGHRASVGKAAFSPNGAYIVTASDDDTAQIWDSRTAELVVKLGGHMGGVAHACFSPDSTRVLTSSDIARLWDVSSGTVVSEVTAHELAVEYGAFSGDGQLIATASTDKSAKVWDAETGANLLTLSGHDDRVFLVAFNHDATRLLTASRDETVRVWDAGTGEELLRVRGHNGSFGPDGSRIVTTPNDETAMVWDVASGEPVLTLRGHRSNVWSAFFSPNGSRIVTGSWDKTAKIWDAHSGIELFTLRGHSDSLWDARFSPDGRRVITASGDQTARVWDAAPWQADAWQDHDARAEMIEMALRHAPVMQYSSLVSPSPDFESTLLSIAGLAEKLNATPSELTAGGGGIVELEGHGLMVVDSSVFAELGVTLLHDGDLVRSINGQLVDDLSAASGILERFANTVRDRRERAHQLRVDILNRYEYRAYIIEFAAPAPT